MMKKCCLLIFLFCYSLGFGGSDMTKSGTATGQFLKIPVGARAIGMGGAFAAVADDASAAFWNPAGLAKLGSRFRVNLSHADWLASTDLNYVSALINLNNYGVLGFGFLSLSAPDMKVRTEFYQEGTGEYFSAQDLCLSVSYAKSLTDRFSIGVSAKHVRQKIWHMVSSLNAYDLGILFKTDLDWLALGASVSNMAPKTRFEGKDTFVDYDFSHGEHGDNENIYADLKTDEWDLPMIFRYGIKADVVDGKDHSLIAAIDVNHSNDNNASLNIGFEYGFLKRFYLRSGYRSLFEKDSEKSFTAGGGLVYYLNAAFPLHMDYAYSDWGRLEYVHRLSFEIQF